MDNPSNNYVVKYLVTKNSIHFVEFMIFHLKDNGKKVKLVWRNVKINFWVTPWVVVINTLIFPP